jgi:hypothetical protein
LTDLCSKVDGFLPWTQDVNWKKVWCLIEVVCTVGAHHAYLTGSVDRLVSQESIPTHIRQLILHVSHNAEQKC